MTLYETLGVAPYASQREIKRAYRRLALRYHPDRNPDNPDAEERFKEIVAANMVLAAQLTPLMVMLAIYAMYFVMGVFFDGISMMIITLPVIGPVVTAVGYDPVWFGVAFVIIMEVGLLTPPVGLNLYVIHGISKHRPFSEVAIGSAPFFMVMLVTLAIVHAFPQLSLWLPSVLLG